MPMGSIHETHSTTIFLNENYKDQSTLVNWRERESAILKLISSHIWIQRN